MAKNRFPAVPKRSIFIKGTPLLGPQIQKISGASGADPPTPGVFWGERRGNFPQIFKTEVEKCLPFFNKTPWRRQNGKNGKTCQN